jgi:hypothetical protein
MERVARNSAVAQVVADIRAMASAGSGPAGAAEVRRRLTALPPPARTETLVGGAPWSSRAEGGGEGGAAAAAAASPGMVWRLTTLGLGASAAPSPAWGEAPRVEEGEGELDLAAFAAELSRGIHGGAAEGEGSRTRAAPVAAPPAPHTPSGSKGGAVPGAAAAPSAAEPPPALSEPAAELGGGGRPAADASSSLPRSRSVNVAALGPRRRSGGDGEHPPPAPRVARRLTATAAALRPSG